MARVLPPQQTEAAYSFSSQPKAVPKRNTYTDKYLRSEENDEIRYGNLMFDRRVIRGNTYSLQHVPISNLIDPNELQRKAEIKRKAIARRKAIEQPVEGRQHQPVQTHIYLEEITDKIEEADADCQTDAFLDRPQSPLFIPAKTGADASTQILPDEVRPIVEVLVGKTIEQSLLEVMEEEELENIRAEQQGFEELKQVELQEQQRLEERDKRIREEKKARKQQQILVAMKTKELQAKIAARVFAEAYLADLIPNVYNGLKEHGYFYDPVERDIEDVFLPWLMDAVDEQLVQEISTRLILDSIIKEVCIERELDFRNLDYPIDISQADETKDQEIGENTKTGEKSEIEIEKNDNQKVDDENEKSMAGNIGDEQEPPVSEVKDGEEGDTEVANDGQNEGEIEQDADAVADPQPDATAEIEPDVAADQEPTQENANNE